MPSIRFGTYQTLVLTEQDVLGQAYLSFPLHTEQAQVPLRHYDFQLLSICTYCEEVSDKVFQVQGLSVSQFQNASFPHWTFWPC